MFIKVFYNVIIEGEEKIREEKRREEKKREGLYTGGAPRNKIDFNKIGFSEEKNEKEKRDNLNGRIYLKNINYIKREEINNYKKIY